MTQRVVNYTYGTGNPVLPNGSIDVRDGIDNLQSFDILMNAQEDTYNQRDGKVVKTVAGAARTIGIPIVGNFTDGCTVTQSNQGVQVVGGSVYRWAGVLPKVVPPASSPASTGGISDGAWVDIGDASAYARISDDLAQLSKGFSGYVFSTVQDLKDLTPVGFGALEPSVFNDTQLARTISYHPGWAVYVEPVGGATYTLTTLAAVRAVRGAGWVPDGYVDHYVNGGVTHVAVILTGDTIAIEQAGSVPNNPSVDNYNNIQSAFNWASTSYGMARTLTAGVGEFYYSKTPLIRSLQPDLGICTGIDGAGWQRTFFVKTSNTPADGTEDYSVDAYIAYETRHPTSTLYCYSSQLKNLTFKSTAPNRHAYGVYGKLITHFDWEEFEVQSAQIGVYAFDAWLMRWRGVRASSCDIGFKIGGTGTTLAWSNVWAHNCKDGGYDITGVVYAEWSNCAADNIFDPANPTVNKVAYKFKNCQGIHLSGCGTENVSEAFFLDNSIVKATAFRVNSIRLGAAGQTLIRAINGSGGSFDSCGFTSVPATSAIAVQYKDATSYLSFANSAFQIANSAVPNDSSSRRQGLVTSMPLDAQGLKTVRLPMNGPTWIPLTALKSGAGFQIMCGVAENADRYITLTKPYWAYSEIGTSAGAPTTIGSLANAAGVAQTSLRAYRAADSYGVEMLYISFSGAAVATILFTLQTAQHW